MPPLVFLLSFFFFFVISPFTFTFFVLLLRLLALSLFSLSLFSLCSPLLEPLLEDEDVDEGGLVNQCSPLLLFLRIFTCSERRFSLCFYVLLLFLLSAPLTLSLSVFFFFAFSFSLSSRPWCFLFFSSVRLSLAFYKARESK